MVILVLLLVSFALATAPAGAGASPQRGGPTDAPAASSFPCQWHWSLQDGLRPGYVTAAINGDCGGRNGSLTLSIRLLSKQRNAKHGTARSDTHS